MLILIEMILQNFISYSIITTHEHAIVKFPNLLHFLDCWVIYKEEKDIPLVGPKHIPPNCWRLGLGREKNHELHSCL
jgi:hypothetical protein